MPEVEYEWIIELKYLKKTDKGKLEQVKVEGLKQLREYASSRKFDGKENMKQALIVFVGKDEYFLFE